jgi:hypothetical protein
MARRQAASMQNRTDQKNKVKESDSEPAESDELDKQSGGEEGLEEDEEDEDKDEDEEEEEERVREVRDKVVAPRKKAPKKKEVILIESKVLIMFI